MERVDLAVVGGGPAGLSAALVAHGNHLRTVLVERSQELGGQVRAADHPIADFLGRPVDHGVQLAEAFADQAQSLGLPVRLGVTVNRIFKRPDGPFLLELSEGPGLVARAVLLATGTQPRQLGLEDEERFGLYERARGLGPRLVGQPVVVIGGGDEACETARWLATAGAKVTLIARGDLRARPLMKKAMFDTPGITVRRHAQVVALRGAGPTLNAVELDNGEVLPAVRCFARIGVENATPVLDPDPAREPDGRVRTDPYGRTSIPGLYAAGDLVVTGDRRYISVATGTGAIVGRAVESDLETEDLPPTPR